MFFQNKVDKYIRKGQSEFLFFFFFQQTAQPYMPSGVQHTLVTLVWTYYWQPYVFPSARTTLDCLCYLYNVCSLIDAALKLCFEKEDGLVLQPYNLKLACLGFFPWQYHEFQQTCLSILCPFFPCLFLIFCTVVLRREKQEKVNLIVIRHKQLSNCLQTDYSHSCVQAQRCILLSWVVHLMDDKMWCPLCSWCTEGVGD